MQNCKKCGVIVTPGNSHCEYCGAPAETTQQIFLNTYQDVGLVAFKKTSILVMILLFIVSFSLYLVVWYFVRRDEIKKIIRDDKKYSALMISYALIVGLNFLLPGIESLILFIYVCLTAHFACVIRVAIIKYVHDSGNAQMLPHVAPSLFLAAVFQIFYLQIHINSLIDSRVFHEK